MAGEVCPYCGALLTTSLTFCVECRRSVTEGSIRAAGQKATDDGETSARYNLSRGSSYDSVRQIRAYSMTLTSIISIFLVYYCVMKFVIHQPVPYEQEMTNFVQILTHQIPGGTPPNSRP